MSLSSPIIITISVFGIVILLIVAYFLTKGGKSNKSSLSIEERQRIRIKWQNIQELMNLGGPSRFKSAVMDADKVLDYVLGCMGYSGSLGDKLKAAKPKFEMSYNDVWQAHIIRNRLVHEVDYEIHSSEARVAISKFEKGLRELGVL